jgi:hypothetical protein
VVVVVVEARVVVALVAGVGVDGVAEVAVTLLLEVFAVAEVLGVVAAEVVAGVADVEVAAGLLGGVPVARTCTLSAAEHAASADVRAAVTASTVAPPRRLPERLIGPCLPEKLLRR